MRMTKIFYRDKEETFEVVMKLCCAIYLSLRMI